MKHILTFIFLLISVFSFSQIKSLPSVEVKKIDGSSFNFKNIEERNEYGSSWR